MTNSLVTPINLRSLRNSSFITFTDRVAAIGKLHNITVLGLKVVNDSFENTLVALNARYATEKGSSLTAKILAADKRRDKAVVGIKNVVDGYLNYFEPLMSEAASQVMWVFDKYNSRIQSLRYNDQSGEMKSLADDLQAAPVSGFVNTLGLSAWVAEMKAANNAFIEVYGNRTTEFSKKSTDSLFDLRGDTLDAYQKLVRSINAVNELNPSPALNAYAAELNAHIEPYNRLISSGGEDEDEDGDDETPPVA